MTRAEIDDLILTLDQPKLIETHISWLLLSGEYAYKIKKPVKFSFLDFSTIAKREFFCHREVTLNRRLTQDIYLNVVPVCRENDMPVLENYTIPAIDFAVKMRRMDETRYMPTLLEKQLVSTTHIEQIAKKLAGFHRCADRIPAPPDLARWLAQFQDIRQISDFLDGEMESQPGETIEQAIQAAEIWIPRLADRIKERYHRGFYIDGHGDLHSGNIFLLEEPVFFDCIEFNDEFRQLDILDEMAFFCLDLDYYRQSKLAEHFLACYQQHYPCRVTEDDNRLFQFFLCYRANVKLKVQTLKAMQATTSTDRAHRLSRARRYHELLIKYTQQLNQ